MSTRMARTAALALVLACGGIVNADNFVSGATGNWNQKDTWLVGGSVPERTPLSGDSVTIGSGHTVTVSSTGEEVTALTISSGGTLVISSGQDLSLAGSSPSATVNGTMTVTGKFVMGVSGATLTIGGGQVVQLNGASAVLLVTANATISGSGALSGNNNSASIQIGANSGSAAVTLQNSGVIKGQMVIKRNVANGSALPTFDNRGLVEADSGIIELASTLNSVVDTVSSSSCADFRWKAATSSMELRFNKVATGLAGDFYAGPGTLTINQNVTSSGLFKFITGGSVVVAASTSFSITGSGGTGSGNHYCSGSNCTGTAFPYSNQTVNCP